LAVRLMFINGKFEFQFICCFVSSMHIGDSPNTLSALCDAVVMARAIFDLAADIGFNLTVVDIGGDCVGKRSSEFYFEEVRVLDTIEFIMFGQTAIY
jgi:hypothetical protein